MIALFGLFAEVERDLISERTKEGLAAVKAKGNGSAGPRGLGNIQARRQGARHPGAGEQECIQGLARPARCKSGCTGVLESSWTHW